jgi:Zn-dependent alcohol dehydrogenase
MTLTARLAVLPPRQRHLELRKVDLPEPGPFEVIVEQSAAGVCHSQLHQINSSSHTQPLVLGHESAGRVATAGCEVTHVQPGDPVLVTWLPRSPSAGRVPSPPKIPLGGGDWAVTHNIFTWGTHAVVDEQFLVPAPVGTPPDVGAIIGCAVMTGAGAVLNTARAGRGHSVVVWGAGGVGLSAVAAAHHAEAYPVIAVDLQPAALRLARAMGADHVVDASAGDPVARIRELTKTAGGAGADYAFDCIGRAETVRACLAAVRAAPPGRGPGGTAVLVGAPQTPVEIDGLSLMTGEKCLAGCLGGDCVPERDFAIFAGWHLTGQLDLTALVSNRYPLEQINQAVDDLAAGRVPGRAILEF